MDLRTRPMYTMRAQKWSLLFSFTSAAVLAECRRARVHPHALPQRSARAQCVCCFCCQRFVRTWKKNRPIYIIRASKEGLLLFHTPAAACRRVRVALLRSAEAWTVWCCCCWQFARSAWRAASLGGRAAARRSRCPLPCAGINESVYESKDESFATWLMCIQSSSAPLALSATMRW